MIIHLISGEAFNTRDYKYCQIVDKHGDVRFFRHDGVSTIDTNDLYFALKKAILFGHLVELGNNDDKVSVTINATNIAYVSY